MPVGKPSFRPPVVAALTTVFYWPVIPRIKIQQNQIFGIAPIDFLPTS